MRIVEKCACGGQVEVETGDDKLAERVVERWRRKHTHNKNEPIPFWPNVTWGSGQTSTTSPTSYVRTTSAVMGTSPSSKTQDEEW